jgi:APA family basic amino acid/polyamine antiporter
MVFIALVCIFIVASTKGTSAHQGRRRQHAELRALRQFGVRGIFSAYAVLLFAYIGFDVVSL